MPNNQYQAVTVPGVGDVNFPTSMSDDDIATAIHKNYPELGKLNQTAARNSSQRLSSTLDTFAPKPQATPALPDMLGGFTRDLQQTPTARARQAFDVQRSAGSREFNQQVERDHTGTVGPQGQLLATTPFAPATARTSAETFASLHAAMSPDAWHAARMREVGLFKNEGAFGQQSSGDVPGQAQAIEDQMQRAAQAGTPEHPVLDRARALNWTDALDAYTKHVLGIQGPSSDQLFRDALSTHPAAPDTLNPEPSLAEKLTKGIGRGALNVSEGLTTPESMALLAGGASAPAEIAKLANMGFSAQMLYGGAKGALEAMQRARGGDIGGAAESGTSALVNAAFGGLGAMHFAHEGTVGNITSEPNNSGNELPSRQPIDTVSSVPSTETDASPSGNPEAVPMSVGHTVSPISGDMLHLANALGKIGEPKEAKQVTAKPEPIGTTEQGKPQPVTATLAEPIAKDNDLPTKPEQTAAEIATHQANNPSQSTPISAMEDNMRGLVGKVLRTKQLSSAAKDRLNVEFALRQIQGQEIDPVSGKVTGVDENQNALAPSNKQIGELSKPRQAMIQAVAKVLDTTPEAIQDNNWRLTDPQVKQLKQLRSAGLRPLSLPGDHPEYPFGEAVPHKLADINGANAKAAGIGNHKDLWAKADEADRQEFKQRRADAKAATEQVSGAEAAREGLNVQGRRAAEEEGSVNARSGKDVETLDFEHGAMQKVLARETKAAQTKLTEAIPAWRQARISETDASPLAKQIAALGKRSKGWLPKELYADEHLTAKGSPTAASPKEPQSIPGAPAAQSAATPEGTIGTTKLEGQGTGAVEKNIDALMQKVQTTHGAEAFGAFPKLYDAVSSKYQSPEWVNRAFYRVAQRYAKNLENKVANPLDEAIETLKSYPPEKGQSTVYANPLQPLMNKLFGPKPGPIAQQPFPNLQNVIQPEVITDFTKAVEGRPEVPVSDQFKAYWANETENFLKSWREMPGAMKERWNALDGFFKKVVDAYKERPGLSAVDLAMGLRNLRLNHASYEMQDFVDTMKARHPEQLRRAAMTAWEEAGGGRMDDGDVAAILQLEANEFHKTAALDRSHRAYEKIYSAATKLSDAEKQTIRDYRDYRARMEAREAQLGLDHDAQLDYLQHIWSRDNFMQNSLKGIQSGRGFGTTANFQRMRKYDTYFEGIHDGLKPNSLDMNYLISARAMSSARVLANRDLVNFLKDHTMPDGLKAVVTEGIGTHVQPDPTEAEKQGAILIKDGVPNKQATTLDGHPYVDINHAAFKNWKWVATASDGTNIMYQGSMRAHPEIATQLKRVLEPSALRQGTLGTVLKPLLASSSVVKQTLLSIGLFHPVQLGTHLTEHAIAGSTTGSTTSRALRALNPFSSEKFVDLDNPIQQQLVVHGLQLRMFDAESLMDEGVLSHGLVAGAPYVGPLWRGIHDAIFQKMIPNMKMAMGQDILNRNMKRYHDDFTRQEIIKAFGKNYATQNVPQGMWGQASIAAQSRIYRLTAEQTNAAFGGIDWSKMPVNKTGQDVLRLLVLAPDFLLARSQFVGDAFRPGGAESRNALGAGFAIQYVLARALNAAANDGDAKWNIRDWNKLILGHHEYSLRTVQGDVVDAILDRRKFLTHRINPLWRPMAEAINQKDIYGHPITGGQLLVDTIKNFTPMPLQGAVDSVASLVNPNLRSAKNNESFADTFTQSMTGIMRKKYRTPAERQVFGDFDNMQANPTNDELSLEQKNTFNNLRSAIREGKLAPDAITKALNDPRANLKSSEVKYLWKTAQETQLVTRGRHLEYDQLHSAWDVASPAEKTELAPLLLRKIKNLPMQRRQGAFDELRQFQQGLTAEQRSKLIQQNKRELLWEREQQK